MLFVSFFMYTGVQHDFHIRWCSCRLAVTLQLSRLKQELLTLLEPLSSSPVFSGVCVAQSIVFFCPFVIFLLAIVLYVFISLIYGL
jgi:hypothetical protein